MKTHSVGELILEIEGLLKEMRLRDQEQRFAVSRLEAKLKGKTPVKFNDAGNPVFMIKKIVAEVCDVPLDILMTHGTRHRWQTWPRHLAMYFCVKHRLGTLREIATQFDRREHGTVLNAKRMVMAELAVPHSTQCKRQHDECLRRVKKIMD